MAGTEEPLAPALIAFGGDCGCWALMCAENLFVTARRPTAVMVIPATRMPSHGINTFRMAGGKVAEPSVSQDAPGLILQQLRVIRGPAQAGGGGSPGLPHSTSDWRPRTPAWQLD